MRSIVSFVSLAAALAVTLTEASSDTNGTTAIAALTTAVAAMEPGHLCGVDFKGGDIYNLRIPNPSQCLALCALVTGSANAVTWTHHQGGTCWCKKIDVNDLRKYIVPKAGAISIAATQISGGNPVLIDYPGWDLVGNDFDNVAVRMGIGSRAYERCSGICLAREKCHAFTLNPYNGGTCWLKSQGGDQNHPKRDTMFAFVVRKVTGGLCK